MSHFSNQTWFSVKRQSQTILESFNVNMSHPTRYKCPRNSKFSKTCSDWRGFSKLATILKHYCSSKLLHGSSRPLPRIQTSISTLFVPWDSTCIQVCPRHKGKQCRVAGRGLDFKLIPKTQHLKNSSVVTVYLEHLCTQEKHLVMSLFHQTCKQLGLFFPLHVYDPPEAAHFTAEVSLQSCLFQLSHTNFQTLIQDLSVFHRDRGVLITLLESKATSTYSIYTLLLCKA